MLVVRVNLEPLGNNEKRVLLLLGKEHDGCGHVGRGDDCWGHDCCGLMGMGMMVVD